MQDMALPDTALLFDRKRYVHLGMFGEKSEKVSALLLENDKSGSDALANGSARKYAAGFRSETHHLRL